MGGWREGLLGFQLLTCFLGLSSLLPAPLLSPGPGSIALAEGLPQPKPWRDAPSPPALLPKQGCRLLWIFLRSGLAVPLYSSQEALTPKSICGRPCLQRGRPRGLQVGHTPNPQHGVEPSTWPSHRAAGDLSASAEPLCASVLHHAFNRLPVCKVYGRFHKVRKNRSGSVEGGSCCVAAGLRPSVLSRDHLCLGSFWGITSPTLWGLLVGLSLKTPCLSLPTWIRDPRQAWELESRGEGTRWGTKPSMLIN